jgi:hypothetical protein
MQVRLEVIMSRHQSEGDDAGGSWGVKLAACSWCPLPEITERPTPSPILHDHKRRDIVELTIFQAVIQWIFLVDFTAVVKSHLSVRIHYLKVKFSVALSGNTHLLMFFLNFEISGSHGSKYELHHFSKSIFPGHSLQSWTENFSEMDCKPTLGEDN